MKVPSYKQTPSHHVIFLSFLIIGTLFVGTNFGHLPVSKAASPALPVNPSEVLAKSNATLHLEEKKLPQGTIYTLIVPAHSPYKVVPLLSKTLATIESQQWQIPGPNSAQPQRPIFLINGGFFDPSNSLTTSFIFQNGVMTADPQINPNLVNNPKLAPYLPKIFNRPEFRVYQCQQDEIRYDIAPRNASTPGGCRLQDALGAGPTLLPNSGDLTEGFVDYNSAGKIIRDPIGVCARNARSVVGLTEKGDVILMMGADNPENLKNSGFTLAEMASLLKSRGAVKAMALDGGSSSSLSYEQKPIYGKLNKQGALVKRPVKSVLMVAPR